MHNIKLTVAYDGTDFHGWQIQPGEPTIQGALTDVLFKLTQERLQVHAAGRTDAGVHARGQVVHFKTRSELLPIEFLRAFNALLPPTIRVLSAEEVGPDFHARWNALAKTYEYRIFRGPIVPPFDWRFVLHYPFSLDEELMCAAARLFEGEHDFASFAASSGSEEDDRNRDTRRHVFSSEFRRDADELVYRIRGRSFLRYMVRKIAGTLLDLGRGKFTPAQVEEIFALRDRSRSGMTLPSHGLCLVSVEYPAPWQP
jgi:tRNA pseudouridine38-40 synthase